MMLARLAVNKLTAMVLVLLAVSALVYTLGSLVPGDLIAVVVGAEGATPEQFEQVRQQLGLDDPLPVQYFNWLMSALQGDLGTSPITGRTVASEIAQQFPVSLELAVWILVLSSLIGIPVGVISARKANRHADLVLRGALLTIFSVPVFVIGVLILMAASRWAPDFLQSSYVPWSAGAGAHLKSITLPLLSILLPITAMTMQMTRGAMLEVLSSPYIVTARAAGVKPGKIAYVHALRNALPPVITFIGFQFGVLLGGLIVVEQIFALPGLGRGMLDAINTRDYPMVTATTMVFAGVFVIINTVIDLLYPILDPRQRSQ